MKARDMGNRITMAAAPVLVGAAAYFLATGYFAASFFAMLGVVLCMETRVRMGLRLPRGGMFVLHVAAGALLLLVLAGLAWFALPAYMPAVAALLLGVVGLTGGVLLGRQYMHLP